MANATNSTAEASGNPGLSLLQSLLDEHPIQFIRFQWVDYTATVRTRLVTIRQAFRLATQRLSISVASPIAGAFLIDGSFHEVNAGAKDSLVPDWSTLTSCLYAPGHATVMCFIDQDGHGFECCPRSVLKRVERELGEQHGISFLVGVEVEFYLTTSAEATAPVKDVASYCSTASLRTPCLAVLEDSVLVIERAGIPVWTFHSELVAGLFEISTEPLTPLQAADALVYIHEAIKATAVKHGLHATMHPKPFDKTHGVGQHLHISLSSSSSSSPDGAPSDSSFLAGVLDSVPAISAISMPNYDSYLRRDFAGGDWVCWDDENRRCSIRRIRPAYWEFRFVDCTANLYLTLAAILGTGTAAIVARMELTMHPLAGRAESLDEESRRALGIRKPAPRGLSEAIEALRGDQAVMAVLGPELTRRYIDYKVHEEERLAELTLQERRAIVMQVF